MLYGYRKTPCWQTKLMFPLSPTLWRKWLRTHGTCDEAASGSGRNGVIAARHWLAADGVRAAARSIHRHSRRPPGAVAAAGRWRDAPAVDRLRPDRMVARARC